MATLAEPTPEPSPTLGRDDRFFLTMALVMMALVFAGFSFHLAMGRSTFHRPLLIHLHAVTFMGWIVIYVLQNIFVNRGSMALHRRLGWLGARLDAEANRANAARISAAGSAVEIRVIPTNEELVIARHVVALM